MGVTFGWFGWRPFIFTVRPHGRSLIIFTQLDRYYRCHLARAMRHGQQLPNRMIFAWGPIAIVRQISDTVIPQESEA